MPSTLREPPTLWDEYIRALRLLDLQVAEDEDRLRLLLIEEEDEDRLRDRMLQNEDSSEGW